MLRSVTATLALAALSLGVALPVPARAQAQDMQLELLAEKARRLGSARVILELRVDTAQMTIQQRKEVVSAAQGRTLGDLSGHAIEDIRQYEYVPFLAAKVGEAALRAAAAHPLVLAVHEDVVHFPALLESGPLVGSTTNPRGGGAHGLGFTGLGQNVAILDTGVDRNHPFLAGKVDYEACFSTSGDGATSACPNGQTSQTGTGAAAPCLPDSTTCLHGTHVAGIAAGNGLIANPPQLFDGIARDSRIIGIQVFTVFASQTDCGSAPAPCVGAFTSNIMQALEHLFSIRGNFQDPSGNTTIASVNLSLGSGLFTSACDGNPLKPSIDLLRGAGIATVIASGNSGYANAISQPACISTAVSVGSTTKQDAVSSFSNSASMLNLLAPGSSINSSVYSPAQQGQYAFLSGTSMATPHVAGAFALLKQRSPAASVSQILTALSSTGLLINDARNGVVKPRIRLVEALNALQPTTPALSVTPEDGHFSTGPAGGPFAPLTKVYTVTNAGPGTLEFSASTAASWATVNPPGGSLAQNASTSVTVSIGGDAASRAPGVYGSSVNFSNTTTGPGNGVGNTSRALSLTVNPPVPANDKFQDGIVLAAVSGNTSGTNAGATKETGEPNHAGQPGGKSVWWRWTAPNTGQVNFDTFGSGFDTVLAAYTGIAVSALTAVASNDNTAGSQSRISFPTVAGVTYHIAVDGVAAASGAIALNWTFGDAVQPGDITVTPSTGFSSSGTAGGPFSPASTDYTVTNVSTGVRIYTVTGLPSWLTASSTTGSLDPGASTTVTLSVNPAMANSLAAGAYSGTVLFNSTGRAVSLTVLGAGLNDAFADAIALSGGAVTATGSNVGASSEPGEPNHAPGIPATRSVWWRWTAAATGTTTVNTVGSGFDTVLAVYRPNSIPPAVSNLTQFASNDDFFGLQSQVTFVATVGVEYWVAVDGYFGEVGPITLNVSGAEPVPPNNAFANATVISGTSVSTTGTNVGATKESLEPDHAGNPGGASVWWRWTAPASLAVTIDTFGSSFDTLLAVYTGSQISSLAPVAANDDFDYNNGIYQSKVSFQAQQETTYFIAVDGYNYLGTGADTGAIALHLSTSAAARRPDFNGDGKADLLWRNAVTGENYLWLMNGLSLSSSGFLRQIADLSWQVAGTGNLDGNGRADILWRNSATGHTYAWLMDGLTISGEGFVRQVADPNWSVAGIADVNGDGRSDVLWRSSATGHTYAWLMDGLSIAGEGLVRQVADANWVMAGFGDLDGDGKADIVWRHQVTGHTYAWLMSGTAIASEGFIRQIPDTTWTIKGIADLDGDGKADIVWRNGVTGQNYLWQMNGLTITGEGFLPTVADQDWQMVGFGDYDGDGKSDIVWRNAAPASPNFGQNYLWLMNGTSIVNQGFLNTVPSTEWAVVNK